MKVKNSVGDRLYKRAIRHQQKKIESLGSEYEFQQTRIKSLEEEQSTCFYITIAYNLIIVLCALGLYINKRFIQT